ncbi:hypothetical protein MMC25_002511 [Agyrium rufum]|nr:hypothetical protein [Agyrium rufum]
MADPSIEQVPKSPFTSILNFRDVGETVNILSGSDILKPNLFYRSARPDTAPSSEKESLANKYHIRTIIDLRSTTEHASQAQRQSQLPSSPSSSPNQPTTPFPPSITRHEISLNGSAFTRALLWKLRWSSLGRLIWTHYTSPEPTAAIEIIGREVMAPRGLLGLGCDTLTYSGGEIRRVFEILGRRDDYPVLVHCTQGKDRTGLIVILVLLLCFGLGREGEGNGKGKGGLGGMEEVEKVLDADYRASERELQPEMEERLKEIRGIGLGGSFAGCPEGFMAGIMKFLEVRFGGVEKYLDGVGVKKEKRDNVREIMMVSE